MAAGTPAPFTSSHPRRCLSLAALCVYLVAPHAVVVSVRERGAHVCRQASAIAHAPHLPILLFPYFLLTRVSLLSFLCRRQMEQRMEKRVNTASET